MTQFNTTLTAAAPRRTAEPLAMRLTKSLETLRQRCAAWFAPVEEVEGVDFPADLEARAW